MWSNSAFPRAPRPQRKRKSPERIGAFPRTTLRGRVLLERGLHRGEGRVQLRAEARHDGDDRNRDAGGDEAVLDGGRPAFVLCETREKLLHDPELHWLAVGTGGSKTPPRYDTVAHFVKSVGNSILFHPPPPSLPFGFDAFHAARSARAAKTD